MTDIVGLWKYLAKHGNQLGGLSAPRFLRMVGKDTSIRPMTWSPRSRPRRSSKAPTSQKDLALVQAAFNQWHAQSGLPLSLSVMLALIR